MDVRTTIDRVARAARAAGGVPRGASRDVAGAGMRSQAFERRSSPVSQRPGSWYGAAPSDRRRPSCPRPCGRCAEPPCRGGGGAGDD